MGYLVPQKEQRRLPNQFSGDFFFVIIGDGVLVEERFPFGDVLQQCLQEFFQPLALRRGDFEDVACRD